MPELGLGSLLGTAPTSKLGALSTRCVEPAETERRLREILPLVPITRVSDLSPLDPIGLPVFVAVTPLARDLTTHAGKGPDKPSARVSAVMEAVERVSAERLSGVPTTRASYAALRGGSPSAVDPRLFDLPDDSAFASDEPLTWVESRDLVTDRARLVPLDLMLSPPSEGILREVDTNGLASGNTLLEAAVHALCEVIERDALSQLEFTTLFGDAHEIRPALATVRPETLPDAVGAWLERVRAEGLSVIVQAIESDLGVPTFRAVLVDPGYPTPEGRAPAYFPGFGTHPSKHVAVQRAVTEALQSRVGFIHGGRDSFNVLPSGPRPAAERARVATLFTPERIAYGDLPTQASLDLGADLRFLLDALVDAGFEQALITDLTRRAWGVPVVRVRVPGLASFLVNRRRVGPRCLRHLIR